MSQNTSSTPDQAGRWVISKFGGPSVLKWESIDLSAEPSPDHVLVRVIAAGIAGTDDLQRAGGYPGMSTPGFTPGHEFVGEVVALGSSVSKESLLAVGDRVASMCMHGAHATHITVPFTDLIRLDVADDLIKVGALPLNYMTAWGMLKRSGVQLPPGSSILIGSASGGVGTAIAQLVDAFDLKLKMIGSCSPSKFDYLRSLGVIPVDRTASDLVDQVRALTDGEGVDVAYDAVGSEESLQNSLLATKKASGEVITIGYMAEIASGGNGLNRDPSETLATYHARIKPGMKIWAMSVDYHQKTPELWVADFQAILEKVRTGELDPKIVRLFRMSDAVEAHEELISGAAVKGKMMFVVDEKLAAQQGL
ncbi:hypothetical protein G7046_g7613 [Stylonectria norvegica]|nr:hypothetical protein G7046_g7613 [Stylonectria norvegica]